MKVVRGSARGRRSFCGLMAGSLLSIPWLGVQAMDPPPAGQAPPPRASARPAVDRDQALLVSFVENTARTLRERRGAWLRTRAGFFACFLQDIQKKVQRNIEWLRSSGWETSTIEAQQRLQKYQAQAQRMEAELHRLYPPLAPSWLQNEQYLRANRVVEERKHLLDALPRPTRAQRRERKELGELLEKKEQVLEGITSFNQYEDIYYPEPPTLLLPDLHSSELLSVHDLEYAWKNKLTELKLRSRTWARATEKLLFEAEKILNYFKEFEQEDNRILVRKTDEELASPTYARFDGTRQRLRTRLALLFHQPLLDDWLRNEALLSYLWQEVNGIRAIAGRRAQADPESAEAPVYTKIQQLGRRALYSTAQTEREQGEADPQSAVAHRGPLARGLAEHAKVRLVGEKLNFLANQGELGALLWLQTLQRLQHSLALVENTLAVVTPTAAARAGQASPARLVEILFEGYKAYKLDISPKYRNEEGSEQERYEETKRHLAGVEALYWKAAAKLFYPYEQAGQELQFYFRPAQGEARGVREQERYEYFWQVWREQQDADQLPRLTPLALDHLCDVLGRKTEAPYDELVIQLLAQGQEPLLAQEQVRIRRSLNQLLARPDWLRLRPQVELVLRTEPLSFYLDLLRGGLLQEETRTKLGRLVTEIQAVARSFQPAPEGRAAEVPAADPPYPEREDPFSSASRARELWEREEREPGGEGSSGARMPESTRPSSGLRERPAEGRHGM